MTSIVIPAHNEVKLIKKTLTCVLADQQLSHCHIIIVCNGCTDNTFPLLLEFVKENKSRLEQRNILITVIDEIKASKTNAINIGIAQVKVFPVVLLDADILIHGADIMRLLNELNEKVIAASPKLQYCFSNSSWLVRAYYAVASCSFYNMKHRLSNVIALSEAAVKKIGKLPNIIADDEYIRRMLDTNEYTIAQTISFDFICPKDVKNLLAVLVRVERGNLQLGQLGYIDNSNANLNGFESFNKMYLPVFLLCKVFAKLKAKQQYAKGKISQWERDESNR